MDLSGHILIHLISRIINVFVSQVVLKCAIVAPLARGVSQAEALNLNEWRCGPGVHCGGANRRISRFQEQASLLFDDSSFVDWPE